MSDSILKIWERIDMWLNEHAPDTLDELRPGCTEEEIHRLERAVSRKLPADMKESYTIHDGTSPGCGLLGGREFLCLRQMQVVWQKFCKSTDLPFRKWLPLATDEMEDPSLFVCLDDHGQVVASWRTAQKEGFLLAPTFQDWLLNLAQDLENHRVEVEGSHLAYHPDALFQWPSTVGAVSFFRAKSTSIRLSSGSSKNSG